MFMHEVEENRRYESEEGFVMQREDGFTPNGNPFADRWVLRGPQGKYVDHDQYRTDLADRHDISLQYFSLGEPKILEPLPVR